jgi:predicted DNA-binding transcriptional regulator AlpA
MRQSTLLTVDKLAQHWFVDESEIYKMLEEGRAPKHVTLPNGQVLFKYADVQRWQDEH